jgi:hypothetical protein
MRRGKGALAAVVVSWQGRAKRLSEPERSLSCQAGQTQHVLPRARERRQRSVRVADVTQ